MRKTISTIAAHKGTSSQPLVCLTAYTAPMARAFDPHCDILLVGDSVAMLVYGEPSTLQADMEMMIRHGRAVVNATQNALVIVDMPFGSYQESKEVAFRNAARILKETGASSVKLEGGAEMAETISYLSTRGVPVVGHVGLQPQSFNATGGYKAQGRNETSAQKIMADAKAVADAGAFAIVIEAVAESLATEITKAISIPTIGIGGSAHCDGQILVGEDMLGMTTGAKPKFVKTYADLANAAGTAVAQYANEVRARTFPTSAHVYGAVQASGATQQQTPVQQAPQPEKLELEKKVEEKPQSQNSFTNMVLRARRPAN